MDNSIKRYKVGGMSCAACAARVEKAVSAMPSVCACNVNLLTNEMSVNADANVKEIEKAVTNAGYVFEGQEAKKDFGKEKTLFVNFVVSIVLLLLLMLFMHYGYKWPQIMLAFSVMMINRRFFVSGFKSIIHLAPNMDTLIAMGSLAAFIYGYYDSAAMILTFITIGKMLESRAKGKTTDAIKNLIKMVPKTDLCVGEQFEVKAGASIIADGIVVDGNAAVDESMLTGESMPVDKFVNDNVSAGTICRTGYLTCRATAVGKNTSLSKIIELVSDAASTKAPIAKTADTVASFFVPAVIGIAALTTLVWLVLGKEVGFALSRGIAVLVISCPCALGLATPVAVMVASGKGAKNGILYKTASSIEECGRIDVVVLDKTGTITKGKPAVTDVIPEKGISNEELVRIATILEKKSEHPLGKAIVEYGSEIQTEGADDFKTLPGIGIAATIDGKKVFGGKSTDSILSIDGKTPMIFTVDGSPIGVIAVADEIKIDSKAAVDNMKKMGLRVIMMTGDNEFTAKAIGNQVGIDEVISNVLPSEKEKEIIKLQQTGNKVAMIGDGINDSVALTRADVGIAIGSGTDVAIDSADVVLMKSSLMDAFASIKLGRKTLRIIKENLFWAFLYNSIGIPIAAGVFSKYGLSLTPALGAACMSFSSICVVSNALRLNVVNIYSERREKTKMITKRFVVDGMMCSHCEEHVKNALEKIPGIERAIADHESKVVEITLSRGVSDEVIKAAIEGAGYKVE